MFARERDYSAFLQTVRIDVGTLVGLKTDEDAYIVLKELPTLEMLRLKEASDKGERATLEVIRELLPSMITDHSFFEDTKGQRKMKAEDVAELVFSSLELSSARSSSRRRLSMSTRQGLFVPAGGRKTRNRQSLRLNLPRTA